MLCMRLPSLALHAPQLVKLRVLIVGLQGVGIECAKNLILAGPGAITLHDGASTNLQK